MKYRFPKVSLLGLIIILYNGYLNGHTHKLLMKSNEDSTHSSKIVAIIDKAVERDSVYSLFHDASFCRYVHFSRLSCEWGASMERIIAFRLPAASAKKLKDILTKDSNIKSCLSADTAPLGTFEKQMLKILIIRIANDSS